MSGPVQLLVHDGPLDRWNDAFGIWWPVSKGTVGSDGVVVPAPLLNDDLRLPERVEDLAVKEFIPEAGIEALTVSPVRRKPSSFAIICSTVSILTYRRWTNLSVVKIWRLCVGEF